MAIAKAKAVARQYNSEEDRRYRQVMDEFDKIFQEGRKEAAQSDGISFRDYMKETRTRLGASE